MRMRQDNDCPSSGGMQKGLPIYIDILYATIHNAYCRLVIAASQQQPDDVGAGVIGVVAQSLPSAVSYAFLVVTLIS